MKGLFGLMVMVYSLSWFLVCMVGCRWFFLLMDMLFEVRMMLVCEVVLSSVVCVVLSLLGMMFRLMIL